MENVTFSLNSKGDLHYGNSKTPSDNRLEQKLEKLHRAEITRSKEEVQQGIAELVSLLEKEGEKLQNQLVSLLINRMERNLPLPVSVSNVLLDFSSKYHNNFAPSILFNLSKFLLRDTIPSLFKKHLLLTIGFAARRPSKSDEYNPILKELIKILDKKGFKELEALVFAFSQICERQHSTLPVTALTKLLDILSDNSQHEAHPHIYQVLYWSSRSQDFLSIRDEEIKFFILTLSNLILNNIVSADSKKVAVDILCQIASQQQQLSDNKKLAVWPDKVWLALAVIVKEGKHLPSVLLRLLEKVMGSELFDIIEVRELLLSLARQGQNLPSSILKKVADILLRKGSKCLAKKEIDDIYSWVTFLQQVVLIQSLSADMLSVIDPVWQQVLNYTSADATALLPLQEKALIVLCYKSTKKNLPTPLNDFLAKEVSSQSLLAVLEAVTYKIERGGEPSPQILKRAIELVCEPKKKEAVREKACVLLTTSLRQGNALPAEKLSDLLALLEKDNAAKLPVSLIVILLETIGYAIFQPQVGGSGKNTQFLTLELLVNNLLTASPHRENEQIETKAIWLLAGLVKQKCSLSTESVNHFKQALSRYSQASIEKVSAHVTIESPHPYYYAADALSELIQRNPQFFSSIVADSLIKLASHALPLPDPLLLVLGKILTEAVTTRELKIKVVTLLEEIAKHNKKLPFELVENLSQILNSKDNQLVEKATNLLRLLLNAYPNSLPPNLMANAISLINNPLSLNIFCYAAELLGYLLARTSDFSLPAGSQMIKVLGDALNTSPQEKVLAASFALAQCVKHPRLLLYIGQDKIILQNLLTILKSTLISESQNNASYVLKQLSYSNFDLLRSWVPIFEKEFNDINAKPLLQETLITIFWYGMRAGHQLSPSTLSQLKTILSKNKGTNATWLRDAQEILERDKVGADKNKNRPLPIRPGFPLAISRTREQSDISVTKKKVKPSSFSFQEDKKLTCPINELAEAQVLYYFLAMAANQEEATQQFTQICVKLASYPRETSEYLLALMLTRGDYYDFNIVLEKPVEAWGIAFLQSEWQQKIEEDKIASEELVEEAHTAWESLHLFYRAENYTELEQWTPGNHTTLLSFLLTKYPSESCNLPQAIQLLYLLQIDYNKAVNILNLDWPHAVLDGLKRQWLIERLPDQVVRREDEIKIFWELVTEIGLITHFSLLEEFLYYIEKSQKRSSLQQINQFLTFLKDSKIEASSLAGLIMLQREESETIEVNLLWWQQELELNLLCQRIQLNGEDEKKLQKTIELFSQLYKAAEWNFILFYELIEKLKSSHKGEAQTTQNSNTLLAERKNLDYLNTVLTTILYYRISKSTLNKKKQSLTDLLPKQDPSTWPSILQEFVLSTYFNVAGAHPEKSLPALITELTESNKNTSQDNSLSSGLQAQITTLSFKIKAVDDVEKKLGVTEWTVERIKQWAKTLKLENVQDPHFLPEMIAVLKQAVYLQQKYRPRGVQVLSLLLLLQGEKDKGRLAQIATGEGKSTIVAMLAAIKALQGDKVDVVTSSPLLAQRDAKEQAAFFAMLGLTVADNSEKHTRTKPCYLQDIVYGDVSTFEADILRDEYKGLGTRNGRPFGVVLVDEVDCMFIDQSGYSTRLTDKIPAMEHFEGLFAWIWRKLECLYSAVLLVEEGSYFLEKDFSDEEALLEAVFYALPDPLKKQHQLTDVKDLNAKLDSFVASGRECTLTNVEYCQGVAALLQDVENDSCWSEKVQGELAKIVDRHELQPDHPLVALVIQDLWNLDSNSKKLQKLSELLEQPFSLYQLHEEGVKHIESFTANEMSTEENPEKNSLPIAILENKNQVHFMRPCPDWQAFLKTEIVKEAREMVKWGDDGKSIDEPEPENKNLTDEEKDKKEKEKIKFRMPTHLKEFFEVKIDKWVCSAITAKTDYAEQRDYLITKSEGGDQQITPVDFSGTGVLQTNTVWSDGLQQFLQLKHEVKITPEHLATNFLSNLAFFKRYKNKIYGLTGTLGAADARNLLAKLYPIDTVTVPTYKPKQFRELCGVVVLAEEWADRVVQNTLLEVNRGRAGLIICETIEEAQQIQTKLEAYNKTAVPRLILKPYTRNDTTEKEAIDKLLEPYTIVLATNLAGRGTDLKLADKVIKQGGLHVCLSFLPVNLRVELQALGRASRQGQPGTAQLVINAESTMAKLTAVSAFDVSSLPEGGWQKIETFKAWRNHIEKSHLANIESNLVSHIRQQDKFFEEFCQLRKMLQEKHTGSHKGVHIISGIAERWGLWLDMHAEKENLPNNDNNNTSQLETKFNEFCQKITREHNQGKPFHTNDAVTNPYYYVLRGNDFNESAKFDKAILNFDKAISQEHVFVANAHYYRAYARLKKGQIKEASEDLVKAATRIQLLISDLICLHNLVSSCELTMQVKNNEQLGAFDIQKKTGNPETHTPQEDSEFTKQSLNKISILHLQLKNIADSLQKINQHQDNIQVQFKKVEEYFKENARPIPPVELREYQEVGLCSFFQVEKKPLPWWDVLAVFLLGAVQIIAGAALTVIGAANIGMGLIGEGIGDIIYGIESIKSGQFSWEQYGIQKGISLAISIGTMGLGALAAKAASTAAFKAVTAALKNVIGRMCSKVVSSSVGRLVVSALNMMKSTLFKTGATRLMTSIKNLVSRAWNQLKNLGQKMVENFRTIKNRFLDNLKKLGNKIVDSSRRAAERLGIKLSAQRTLDQTVKKSALSAMQKQGFKLAGKVVGGAIVKAAASYGFDYLFEEATKKIVEAIYDKLSPIIKDKIFHALQNGSMSVQINKIIHSSANNSQSTHLITRAAQKILHPEENFVKKAAREIGLGILKGLDLGQILEGTAYVERAKNLQRFINILTTLSEMAQAGQKVAELADKFLTELQRELQKVDTQGKEDNTKDTSNIKSYFAKIWGEEITQTIVLTIQHGLLKPLANYGFQQLTHKMMKNYDESLKNDLAHYQTERNLKHAVNKLATANPKAVAAQNNLHTSGESNPALSPARVASDEAGHIGCFPGLVAATGQPIELYTEKLDGSVEYFTTYGRNHNNCNKPPIRLLFTPSVGPSKEGHYDLIEKTANGKLQVKKDLYLTGLKGKDCLFAAVSAGSGNQVSVPQLRNAVTHHITQHQPRYLKHFGFVAGLPTAEQQKLLRVGGTIPPASTPSSSNPKRSSPAASASTSNNTQINQGVSASPNGTPPVTSPSVVANSLINQGASTSGTSNNQINQDASSSSAGNNPHSAIDWCDKDISNLQSNLQNPLLAQSTDKTYALIYKAWLIHGEDEASFKQKLTKHFSAADANQLWKEAIPLTLQEFKILKDAGKRHASRHPNKKICGVDVKRESRSGKSLEVGDVLSYGEARKIKSKKNVKIQRDHMLSNESNQSRAVILGSNATENAIKDEALSIAIPSVLHQTFSLTFGSRQNSTKDVPAQGLTRLQFAITNPAESFHQELDILKRAIQSSPQKPMLHLYLIGAYRYLYKKNVKLPADWGMGAISGSYPPTDALFNNYLRTHAGSTGGLAATSAAAVSSTSTGAGNLATGTVLPCQAPSPGVNTPQRSTTQQVPKKRKNRK